jgi:hypothetical protein
MRHMHQWRIDAVVRYLVRISRQPSFAKCDWRRISPFLNELPISWSVCPFWVRPLDNPRSISLSGRNSVEAAHLLEQGLFSGYRGA